MNRDDEIFSDALDLPPADRDAFLDQACAGDPAQRDRIAALLAAAAAAHTRFLAPPPGRASLPAEEKPGDIIDRYTLVRLLGQGGCGSVWLAEQSEPVRRQVALKVIKLGMDTREVVTRFAAERQVLARMDHPDIARVFDAGSTASGRPYFVMEFVDGAPITRFCDEHRLTTDARLALFSRVCLAVQHAHQKGVIHRDLKPSNILVALHGGVPTPKIIDFGIAKATGDHLADHTLVTAVQQFIGTPAYMSPEQAELGARDLDTRSDIYSLGVLLYELLTGCAPFDPLQLVRAGLDEMRRQIREVDPPRPSTRLNTLEHATLAATAAQRLTNPPRLLHRLRGDLDWIVMRCLEKDRARRYESAGSLAEDLRRHLHDEPVAARPASRLYRLRKLVRRHRIAFAAGAAVFVALIAGATAATWQAVRASRAELLARTEADAAKAVSEFLTNDLLRQADSSAQASANATPDPDLKVRTALDRAAAVIGTRFPSQPLVEASVRLAIADAYLGLGLASQAVPHLERALELRRHHLGPIHRDTLWTLATLAHVLDAAGHATEGERLARESLRLRTEAFGPEDPDTLRSQNVLALILLDQGKFTDVIDLRLSLVEIARRRLGPEHSQTLELLHNLAEAYRRAGKLPEAIATGREVVDLKTRTMGAEHPLTISALANLCLAYDDAGQSAEQLPLAEKLLETRRRLLGAEHPDTIISTINLASILNTVGRREESAAMGRDIVPLARRILGPEATNTMAAMNNLAITLSELGRGEESAAVHLEALEILRRKFGLEHPATLSSTNNLATTYVRLKRYREAHELNLQVFAAMPKVFGPEHPNTYASMNNLGRSYGDLGQLPEAIDHVRAAATGLNRVLGPDHPSTLVVTAQLGNFLAQAGRLAEAADVRREIHSTQRTKLGADHASTITTAVTLALNLLDLDRPAEAESLLREVVDHRTRNLPDDWSTFNARSLLGGALLAQGRLAEAEPLLREAHAGLVARADRIPPASFIRYQDSFRRLAELCRRTDRAAEAARWEQSLAELTPPAPAS